MKDKRREFWLINCDYNWDTGLKVASELPVIAEVEEKVKVVEIDEETEAVYNKDDVEGLLEALRFYEEARLLMISKNGKMPDPFSPDAGCLGGYQVTEQHIKDDGKRARQALKNWERGE